MKFEDKLKEYAESTIQRHKEIQVINVAVLARQENDLYDLYLPYQWKCKYYFREPLSLICNNVEAFQYKYKNGYSMLLIKVKNGDGSGFWMPIFLDFFTWCLNAKLAQTRFIDTPKIYFEGDSEASILEDFDYLFDCHMVQIDGKNYLIQQNNMCVDGEEIEVKIKEFPSVEPMLTNCEFKVINDTEEYVCRAYDGKISFGPATSIENIKEYQALNNDYSGYFSRDSNNNIIGIYIASKCLGGRFSYKIQLSKPATKVTFVGRVIKKLEDDYPKVITETWGITDKNGESSIIIQTVDEKKHKPVIIPI